MSTRRCCTTFRTRCRVTLRSICTARFSRCRSSTTPVRAVARLLRCRSARRSVRRASTCCTAETPSAASTASVTARWRSYATAWSSPFSVRHASLLNRHENPVSELRSVTCHMGSHSVTCQSTQVNATRHNSSHTGRYSIYLPRRDGRLS